MSFLDKFFTASSDEIQNQIDAIQSELDTKRTRLEQLKQEIGLAYGDVKKVTKLKAEYADTLLDIEALPVTLEQLQNRLYDAQSRELLQAYRNAAQADDEAYKALDKADHDLIPAFKALMTVYDRHRQTVKARQATLQQLGRLREQIKDRGLEAPSDVGGWQDGQSIAKPVVDLLGNQGDRIREWLDS